MAPITVYFDDSGTHPGAPVAIAAAWLSPVEQWKRFCRDWEKLKRDEGFNCFHMAEFMANNPRSEFADRDRWNEKAKTRLLNRIAEIIKQRAVKGFALSISQQDYDDLVQGELRRISGRYHYTHMVSCVIGMIEQWRLQRTKEPTEYIFDRMTKGSSKKEIESIFHFAELHGDALHKYGIYKGCHSFRDKNDVLPLQAADIFAWMMNQRTQNHYNKKPMHPVVQKIWNSFVAHKGRQFLNAGFIDRQQMARWVAKSPTRIPPDLPS